MTPPAARPAFAVLARGLLLPLAAGAAAVLAFAPFHFWPAAIIALAALFFAWHGSGSPLQAALSGFAFGLGLNLAGVSWVFVSLHEYGHMPAALAAIATFAFCAFISVFPGLAGWAAHRFCGPGAWRAFAAIPAWFAIFEWVRGWIFTGFPWLAMGYSQVPGSPLAGFAPVLGVYGVSLAVAIAAAFSAALATVAPWSRSRGFVLAGLAAIFAAGGLLGLVEWTVPAGEPVTVSLLQGNVSQHLKFRSEVRNATLEEYRAQVFASAARVVVLPETALPALFDQLPEGYVESLVEHGRVKGKDVLLGTAERRVAGDAVEYFNSVVNVGASGQQSYRKRHLVPWGEFIPPGFGWIVSVLRIPLQDMSRGERRQPPIRAGGTSWAVAICYEDAFGEELIDFLPSAQLLVNVTNDAWYGESLAAEQHLQLSQMRALESGRWMVRATNTGVTAAIDHRGSVVARLPQFTRATLQASPQPRSGATPYSRYGSAGALALLLVLITLSVYRSRVARPLRPAKD